MNKRRMQSFLLFILLVSQLGMMIKAKDVNIALGKSYTLSPEPNYPLCTDKEDLVQLTDGKYIKGGTMWLAKGAVGWHLETPIVITIDLDKVEPITGVSINAAAGAADVAWPRTALISVSTDGKKFEEVGNLIKLSGGIPNTSGYAVHAFKANKIEAEGRYVRLTIDPGGPYKYLFLDEIEIYGGSGGEHPKLAVQSVVPENMIKNPDFEEWKDTTPIGWEIYCNEPNSVSRSEESYNGNFAVKISHEKDTSYSWIRQVIEVEPNTFYEGYISVRSEDVKLSIGEGVNAGRILIADYPVANAISQSAIVEGSSEWGRRYIRFNSGNRTKIYFYIYLHKASGTMWVNDAFLTPSDEDNDYISEWRRKNRLLQDLKMVEKNIKELETNYGIDTTKLKIEIGSLESQINSYAFVEDFDYTQSPPYNKLHSDIYSLNGKVLGKIYPQKKMMLWTEGKWNPLKPLQLPGNTAKVCLYEDLMLNEWGASAFNITNVTTEPLSVTVSLEGLSAGSLQFPLENIIVREVIFAESYTGRIQADALRKAKKIGDNNYLITIPPGSTSQVWLQINGKSFDKPGAYDGIISVSSSGTIEKVYLTVDFWPINFPEETTLYTYNWSYLNNPVLRGREEEAVEDLFNHYINTFIIHDPFLPWPVLDKDGNILSMDFSKLDQQLDYHSNAKMYMFYLAFEWFPHKIHGGFSNFEFMSPQWERGFEQWIRAMVAHLEGRGISKDQFAFYPVDETTMKAPSYNGLLEYFLLTANKIKEIDPELIVFVNPIGTLDMDGLSKISGVSDILCPDLQRMIDPVESSAFSNTGKQVWIYQPWGPSKDLSPIGYYRLQIWRNWQLNLGGSGFWNYAGNDAWDDFLGYRYSVVYGTKEELVPSKRWEAWREGVQDFEYLSMLEREVEKVNGDNNKTVKEAKEFFEEVPPIVFQEAVSNPDLINEARKEILRLLMDLQNINK